MSYRKVEPRMWDDERFAVLSKDGKLAWLCILTGPHTTALPGLWACGVAALAESMRDGIDTVSKALNELAAAGMVRFNPTVRVLQVPNAPKYNPCANLKVLKGWFSLWKNTPDCREKFAHLDCLQASLDMRQAWCASAWRETFGTVSVPDRYRIDTVSISVTGAVTGAVAVAVSPPGSAEGATAPEPPPPVVPPSDASPTSKGEQVEAKGPKTKRAKPRPPPDPVPAPNTLARRIYDAIIGDPILGPITVNPGDAAERWADPATFPGVDVLAEVKQAGEWASRSSTRYRDGRSFLSKWLKNSANDAAARPRPAAGAPASQPGPVSAGRGRFPGPAPISAEYAPVDNPEMMEIFNLEQENARRRGR